MRSRLRASVSVRSWMRHACSFERGERFRSFGDNRHRNAQDYMKAVWQCYYFNIDKVHTRIQSLSFVVLRILLLT